LPQKFSTVSFAKANKYQLCSRGHCLRRAVGCIDLDQRLMQRSGSIMARQGNLHEQRGHGQLVSSDTQLLSRNILQNCQNLRRNSVRIAVDYLVFKTQHAKTRSRQEQVFC
jgi:hypothetical protein